MNFLLPDREFGEGWGGVKIYDSCKDCSISDNSEDMSPLDICLAIEAIAYFPSIVKLLLKIKLWKLGIFGIWQLLS